MYGFLPLNETIVLKRTEKDAWGLSSPTAVEKFYRVHVDYEAKEAKLSIANGSETVITGAIVFVGEVDVKRSDIVVVGNDEFTPKSISPMKDFGGKVIHTRILF